MTLIRFDNVSLDFGELKILDEASMSIEPGERVCLIGRNGAGKSTTIKSIMGMVKVTQGSIRFGGDELVGEPPYRIARRGIGYVPEERRVFTRLTVQENLEAGEQAPRGGAPHWRFEDLFDLFPNLAEARHRLAGTLSGGEQQMLTIARTLMGNPGCILLDEPSEGLAPVIVEQMAATIAALKREGLTVLLSEQNLYFARELSDRAYVIESGRIRDPGTMAELAADETVRQAYLTV